MAPRSAGRYVRPLLCLRRKEIEEYLKKRGLSWREDKSNRNVEFLRNRIRHELIPLLESYNPAISERLGATAEALTADEEVLDALTREAFERHALTGKEEVILSIHGVRKEPAGIRMRLYRRAIREARGDLVCISFRHLKEIDRLFFSQNPNAAISLPDGLRALRRYGEISFSAETVTASHWSNEITIEGPGIYPLPGGGALSVVFAAPPKDLRNTSNTTEYFSLDEAPFPWRIRTFRPGDRISPLGMSGHKKVKDLFIDQKVPVRDRRRIPLVFYGDTLLWAAGLSRAGAAAIKAETSKAVRIELVKMP
jgi:tRNA(Ile)-lysidine synthase